VPRPQAVRADLALDRLGEPGYLVGLVDQRGELREGEADAHEGTPRQRVRDWWKVIIARYMAIELGAAGSASGSDWTKAWIR
jgi:hypothetical protein